MTLTDIYMIMMFFQARLPGATKVEEIVKKTTDGAKVYAKDLVRVDSDAQKLDKFFRTVQKPTNVVESNVVTDEIPADVEMEDIQDIVLEKQVDDLENSIISEPNEYKSNTDRIKPAVLDSNISYIDPKESFKTRTFQYERVETKLTSVKQLRLDVENNCNMNLREILANLIFIACIDSHRSLIQHSTKLYLCDTTRITYVFSSFIIDSYESILIV